MPIIYATSLKTRRMEAVRDAIDAGAGSGYIQIGTAGMAIPIVDIILANVSCTIAGSVLTLSSTPRSGIANETAIAESAQICDSNGNVVVGGLSVGEGGTDIIIDNVNIGAGQTVQIISGRITHG